jgi:hypothetical protein
MDLNAFSKKASCIFMSISKNTGTKDEFYLFKLSILTSLIN